MMVSGYEQHVVSVRVVQLQIGRKWRASPNTQGTQSHTHEQRIEGTYTYTQE